MSLYEIAVADGHQHKRGAVLLAVLGNPFRTLRLYQRISRGFQAFRIPYSSNRPGVPPSG